MAEIKFDEADEDTNLAKEYLKNNKMFKSKGFKDSKLWVNNDYDNKIHYSEYKRSWGAVVLRNDITDLPEKLYNLAKKVEENADLFCQLELLIRKIPLKDTKNIDLQMIIQNYIYYSSARPQVAKTDDFLDGGVGIVSGKGDVDSAVDTFLASSRRYPWKLKRIFVQECALERFKRALAWKSEGKAAGSGGVDAEVSCAASYRCGDRVFSLEAAGSCGARVVALEAYRTVRELLALLGALRPLAASLWSTDVAESLEIAHGLSATVVWVNDFADFRGPPRVSQAFFSVIDLYFSTRMMAYMPEFDEFIKFREPWLRLDVDERKKVVQNALSKINYKIGNNIIEAMKTHTFEMDSFVYVTKNMVSTGIELLPEMMLLSSFDDRLDLSIICYIIKGGAVLLRLPDYILKLKENSIFYTFYDNLRILGAPVIFTKGDYKFGKIPILIHPINRYKVVWTSYGTIFAN